MDWNAIRVVLCAAIFGPMVAALSASITFALIVDLIEQIREFRMPPK